MNKYSGYKPMGHSLAEYENKMSNIYAGSESFFTVSEAKNAISELESDTTIKRITVIENCPHIGYTRISAGAV